MQLPGAFNNNGGVDLAFDVDWAAELVCLGCRSQRLRSVAAGVAEQE
jgi:hypothetical protein